MTTPLRLLLAPLAALAALLVLTSCGEDTSPQSGTAGTSTEEHNQADVDFATAMIPHHAQALSMVDLTLGRDLSPEVSRLAEEIRSAQGPEIEQMTDWLEDWDEPVPETMRDHANAHDDGHGDSSGDSSGDAAGMPGMMSEQEMSALEQAPDPDFERMFLEMMIEHHEGAVQMASTEQQEGRYRPAVDLARQVEKAQTAEIEEMRSLLGMGAR